MTVQSLQELQSKIRRLLFDELDKVIVGYEPVRLAIGAALLANGHMLLESIPGLSKTTLAKCLAAGIEGATFSRIQCTPDLRPSDVTGGQILNQASYEMTWISGPVFANVVLVDEINRTTPKTQSALLEAMEERQVTIGRETRELPSPFILIATQNPIEQEGTFTLPEAQIDRFLIKVVMTYLDFASEVKIVRRSHQLGRSAPRLIEPQLTIQDVRDAQSAVSQIAQRTTLQLDEYITRLMCATRPSDALFPREVLGEKWQYVRAGAAPRLALGLKAVASAMVFIEGRDYIEPDDVKRAFPLVARHRIALEPLAQYEGLTAEDVIAAILSTVPING